MNESAEQLGVLLPRARLVAIESQLALCVGTGAALPRFVALAQAWGIGRARIVDWPALDGRDKVRIGRWQSIYDQCGAHVHRRAGVVVTGGVGDLVVRQMALEEEESAQSCVERAALRLVTVGIGAVAGEQGRVHSELAAEETDGTAVRGGPGG